MDEGEERGVHTRLWFHDRGASHTRGSQWLDMAGEAGSKERDTKNNKSWLRNCKKCYRVLQPKRVVSIVPGQVPNLSAISNISVPSLPIGTHR